MLHQALGAPRALVLALKAARSRMRVFRRRRPLHLALPRARQGVDARGARDHLRLTRAAEMWFASVEGGNSALRGRLLWALSPFTSLRLDIGLLVGSLANVRIPSNTDIRALLVSLPSLFLLTYHHCFRIVARDGAHAYGHRSLIMDCHSIIHVEQYIV